MSSNTFNNQMSLYIPRCDTRSLPRYTNFSSDAEYEVACKDFIATQFRLQKIGQVGRVDLVRKTNPQGFYYFIAFIHFNEWFDHDAARSLQASIANETKAKLQYSERWYWIVNENKNPRTVDQLRTEKMARLEETCARQAAQMADMMSKLEMLSCQVASSVLPEEDQEEGQLHLAKAAAPRSKSPMKKRRIARPSPVKVGSQVTVADHVAAAMEKLSCTQTDAHLGEAIASVPRATEHLTVNVSVTDDGELSDVTTD